MLDYDALQKFGAVTALLQEIYRSDLQMIASTPHSVTFKLRGDTNYLKLMWDRHGMDMLVFTPAGGVLTDLRKWDCFQAYWKDPKRVRKDSKKSWPRSLTYHQGMFASEYQFPFSDLGVNTLSSLVGFIVRRSNSMTEDNRQAVRALKLARLEEELHWAMAFQEPDVPVASQEPDKAVASQEPDETLHTNTEDLVWGLPSNIPALPWAAWM